MKKRPSVDGFMPARRRDGGQRFVRSAAEVSRQSQEVIRRRATASRELYSGDQEQSPRQEIQQSLRAIDTLAEPHDNKKAVARQQKLDRINKRRRKKGKAPLTHRQFIVRKWLRRVVLATAIVMVVLGGSYIYRSLGAVTQLVRGNIFDAFTKKERLQQDDQGRTNILLFGTSPEGWDGADLADSIIVMTLDQDKGTVYTVSLPRDLYVKHSCKNYLGTTAGKLNESYICGKKDAEVAGVSAQDIELAGQKELARAVSSVLGLSIHYQVHANWRVLTSVVDAIGGVDVLVEAYDGSKIVHDVSTGIRYRHGQQVHMSGDEALKFSRARGAFGGTGLSGGNFDRERNQQKVLAAIINKIKATNKADIHTMTNILSALGDNISTSFETKELQTLVGLAGVVQPEKIQSIPLVGDDLSLLTNSNINGASVVVPTAGTYSYQQIQAHVQRKTNSSEAAQENANIVVLNASGVTGVAAKHQEQLAKQGLQVSAVGNITSDDKAIIIYSLTTTKPHTLEALKKRYGDTIKTKEEAPSVVKQYDADIVIVIGDDQA